MSNIDGNGNGTHVTPIKIDTSKLKFEIDVDHNALTNLAVTGNTQRNIQAGTGLDARISDFLVPHNINGHVGVSGINRFYKVDASGHEVDLTTDQEIADAIRTYGLTIRFKVTATRTQGRFVAGTDYEFDSLALLQAELNATNGLNFDRSTLMVQ